MIERRKEFITRIGEDLKNELREIARKRRQNIDKKYPKEISFERLTNGIVRCIPEWLSIKSKLLKEPRIENEK